MEETLNSTIDPACLQEPPLAMDVIKQLDVLGLCLYSMLTLMSCISLLLYLEQCAYLYRNLPNPKKTTLMWISGAAPVISTMACFGMWIPRAVMFTDMTSNCYFAVVVYKVVVLIVQEFGGTGAFLKRFSGKPFKVSTGPCCCCCLCLPRVPMSRRWFFFLKLGVLQYAILKTVLSILCIVLWTNGNFDLSDLEITGTAIWINPFIGVLTIISLWPVAIIFMNTNSFLRDIKIVPKYALYQYNVQSAMADKGASERLVETRPLLILVLSQLQTSIINILALDGTIACAPPFSSQARGSMLSQQMMIMEMFIITLINQSLYRRTYDKLPSEVHDNENNAEVALQAAHVEHDV